MNSLLFDDLLDRLEDEHFTITVTHRLRVHQLVLALEEPIDPGSLGPYLRPLLATSPEEQGKFDRVYREYLHARTRAERKPPEVVDGTRIDVIAQGTGTEPRRMSRALVAGIVSAMVLVALLAIVVVKPWSRPAPPPEDTTRTTTALVPAPTPTPIPQPEPKPPKPKPEPAKPKEPPLLAALKKARPLLERLAMLIVAVLLYDVVRLAKRWMRRRAARGTRLPYRWPLRAENVAEVFDTPALDEAVRRLRRRAAGERMQLDVEATIRATAAAARYPTFVHAVARQSPRYVVLIERRSPDDQLARYFHALTAALRARDVEVDVYEYKADPRTCVDPRTGARLAAGDVRERHPASRLLLMGSGEELTQRFRRELREWVETDLEWRVRGMLIPEWTGGGVEHALAPAMAVSRADAEGLLHLAEMLDRGEHARHRISSTFSDSLDQPLAANPAVSELRRVLDPAIFRWLCACALHPELHWDITIRLGRLLLPTLDERRLLQLVRLPWFREGGIADARREELAEAFRPDPMFAAAHRAIADVLSERKPPARTYAAEVQSMRSVTHRILAAPEEKRRPLIHELRRFSIAMVRGNDDLSEILVPPRHAPRLGRVMFRGGTPALGVRNFLWTAVLVMFALLLGGAQVATGALTYAVAEEGVERNPVTSASGTGTTTDPSGTGTTTTTTTMTTTATTTVATDTTSTTEETSDCRPWISTIGNEWNVFFTNCAIQARPGDRWELWVENFQFTLSVIRPIEIAPPMSHRSFYALSVMSQRPTVTNENRDQLWQTLRNADRGTLKIGSVVYSAILDVTDPQVLIQFPESVTMPRCSGTLARVSADIWRATVDAACGGFIEAGTSTEVVYGQARIPAIVQTPDADDIFTFQGKPFAGTIVVPLLLKGTLEDAAGRTVGVELGGKTYELKVTRDVVINLGGEHGNQETIPMPGAQLPLEEDQLVMFRWPGVVNGRPQELQIQCKGVSPRTVRASSNSYAWAPPVRGRGELQCSWQLLGPDIMDITGRPFTVVERELLEVDWRSLETSVVVDGKIDGKIKRLTVNGTLVPLNGGRFAITLPKGTMPMTITTVVTLPDDSEIADVQQVPR